MIQGWLALSLHLECWFFLRTARQLRGAALQGVLGGEDLTMNQHLGDLIRGYGT